jgi:hypothetical protein
MNADECGHDTPLDYAGRCKECLEDRIDQSAEWAIQDAKEGR